jgi:hypothetical protein
MKPITENIIEASAIEILQSHGWESPFHKQAELLAGNLTE